MAARHYKLLLPLLFFYVCTIAVTGQQPQLNDPITVSDCSQGLRAQEDSFVIIGEVDVWGMDILNWRYIDFYVISKGAAHWTACFVDIMNCTNTPSAGCYCADNSGGKFKVVMNHTATMGYSNAEVKLIWKSVDQSKTAESRVVQLPTVYVQNQETLTLTVNGAEKDLMSKPCTFSLAPGNNLIKFCCNNSPSQCTTKITRWDGRTSGTTCVQLEVWELADGIYRFTHDVCGRESKDITNCKVNRPPIKPINDSNGLRPWAITMTVIAMVGTVLRLG